METLFCINPPPHHHQYQRPIHLQITGRQISIQQINLVSICRLGRKNEKTLKREILIFKLLTTEKFILKGYFRFHSSSPGKKGSRSQWKKWGLCGKWKWNHLRGSYKHSTSLKRQEDSSAIARWVGEYFIMEWRNIWWFSCKYMCPDVF